MLKNIYSVFDNVTKLYSAPFTDINNGSVMRGLQDMMEQQQNHPYSKFPDNYTLYNIGTFSEDLGVPEPAEHAVVAELISIKLPKDMEK